MKLTDFDRLKLGESKRETLLILKIFLTIKTEAMMFKKPNTIIKIHIFILSLLICAVVNLILKSDNTCEPFISQQSSSHHEHLPNSKDENILPSLLFSNQGDKNKCNDVN
ncbi:hypothetical protein [Brasilonema sp. UFV-L1]|uniref:hypothetical protein n=1 Tax=Brasilonema sp. UFV-L1 TaxID=2234130 RepID=UPI00145CC334|nr:hypothetical protein [Brasilonema sp. UFV-L1]NMG09517.1 hypothetical protein [Brasilonema sp. UFV-L1]